LIEGRGKLDLSTYNICNCLAVIFRLKGSIPCDQFIQKDTCRPYIYFFIIPSSSKHLRCSVIKGSSDGEHVELSTSTVVFPANSKVNEFKFQGYRIIQQVLKLDVSMSNRSLMKIVQSFHQLLDYSSHFRLTFERCPSQTRSR